MADYSGPTIMVTSIVFPILAAVIVALRFYCRRLKKTSYGIDDWLIIPALLAAVGRGTTNIFAVFAGRLGQHQLFGPRGKPIFDGSFEVLVKVAFVDQALDITCHTFAKLSILFFYRRIFRGTIFNMITWALILLSTAWGITFLTTLFTLCIHSAFGWTIAVLTTCNDDIYSSILASIVSNVVIDAAILCIPWPHIWQVQMPAKQKSAVISIFMLGAFVCGMSIARAVTFERGIHTSSPDILFEARIVIFWAQLEASFAVICACLPLLRPALGLFSFKKTPGIGGRHIPSLPRRTKLSSSQQRLFSSQPQSTESMMGEVPDGCVEVRHVNQACPSFQSIDDLRLGDQHKKIDGIQLAA